jgi:hypothetical protein
VAKAKAKPKARWEQRFKTTACHKPQKRM